MMLKDFRQPSQRRLALLFAVVKRRIFLEVTTRFSAAMDAHNAARQHMVSVR